MKKFFALIATFALAFTLVVPGIALGDAGSFSGSSSYGGSSSYSSSGSSSSSSSSSYSRDYDYDSNRSSGSGEYTDEEFYTYMGIFIVIMLIVAYSIIRDKFGGVAPKRKSSRGNQPAGAAITPQSDLKKMAELVEIDPDFNKKDVEERVANIYVKMQNAWTAGDFEPMRPYFTNNMFAQFDRQLKQMKAQGLTNYVDNITVLEVTARGWFSTGTRENIVLKVRTRINDYIVDANGKCVQGTPTRELFMEYEYTLTRPAGTKTVVQGKHADSKHCPNCGAPLDEAASAKCPYCDSVITIDQHDWVISAIKGISQQNAN